MEIFDKMKIERFSQDFTPWKRIAFMVLVGERMIGNYRRFSEEAGFGDVSILREALDTAWMWIENGRLPGSVAELRNACEQQAPDTEQFNSSYTSAALDAANVAAIILDSIERPDDARPIDVASLARDSVDLFVQERMKLNPAAPGFEEAILRHHLMQNELRHQREDLQALSDWSGGREMAACELRSKSARWAAGSLDG